MVHSSFTLTSIAGLVHVFDLNLTTLISKSTSPCGYCMGTAQSNPLGWPSSCGCCTETVRFNPCQTHVCLCQTHTILVVLAICGYSVGVVWALSSGFARGHCEAHAIPTLYPRKADTIHIVWVWHGPTWVWHGLACAVTVQRPHPKPLESNEGQLRSAYAVHAGWTTLGLRSTHACSSTGQFQNACNPGSILQFDSRILIKLSLVSNFLNWASF